MSWFTPDRPSGQPIDPGSLGGRAGGGSVVLILSIIACLWVLLTRWGFLNFIGGGWLWIAANAVAPYAAVGFGALAFATGLIDRLFGGFRETHMGKGLIALALGVLVLWPRYAPTGLHVYTAEETVRRTDGSGTPRRERVLHCVYLRLDLKTEQVSYAAGPYGQACPRLNWPS